MKTAETAWGAGFSRHPLRRAQRNDLRTAARMARGQARRHRKNWWPAFPAFVPTRQVRSFPPPAFGGLCRLKPAFPSRGRHHGVMNLIPASQRAETPIGCLVQRVRARGAVPDGEARPAAILWTDPGRDWSGILGLLRDRLPELLVLGEDDRYDPVGRSGPAIWLRCVVDGTLEDGRRGDPRIPILYLPGVARQDLRAGDDCPDRLKPLVELLHRGVAWHHQNGRDWTASAFLGSSEGLGLELASDRQTAAALRTAMGEVALTKLTLLRGRRLEADDFNRLMVDDLPQNVLRWLGDADETRSRLGDRWEAFRGRCNDELEFDPETSSELTVGRKLGEGAGTWASYWARYADAPEAFPGVESLLRRCQPRERLLTANPAHWPNENDRLESALRDALRKLTALPHPKACDEVEGLESRHGKRRAWVWSRLGQTPLADALEPLARLAAAVRSSLGGSTPDDVAAAYRERGWQADAAGWEALAGLRVAEEPVVAGAVRHLLEPWLDESARAFQEAVRQAPLPGAGAPARRDGGGGRGGLLRGRAALRPRPAPRGTAGGARPPRGAEVPVGRASDRDRDREAGRQPRRRRRRGDDARRGLRSPVRG